LKRVVKATTAEDAINLYEAIALARPGGLGKSSQLDVNDPKSRRQILDRQLSLFDVFRISAPWDSISNEWVTGYHVTFDIGYPFFQLQLSETEDINKATVHTYLKILSEVPDTLIQRKAGVAKSKWVSNQAERILEVGGLNTSEGRRSLRELDHKLHDAEHKLNPGTTADLTSAVLAVAILDGYRP
jgi:triphosphoribosyl-dephospho-CoA synthase